MFSLMLAQILLLKTHILIFSALTLASSEVRFNIDSETHDPIDLQKKELRYKHM